MVALEVKKVVFGDICTILLPADDCGIPLEAIKLITHTETCQAVLPRGAVHLPVATITE